MSLKFFYLIFLSIYHIVMSNEAIRQGNEKVCIELLKRIGEDVSNINIIDYKLDHIQIAVRPNNSEDKNAVRIFIRYLLNGTQTYDKSFSLKVPLISPIPCGSCGIKRSQNWNSPPEIYIYSRGLDPSLKKSEFKLNDYVNLFWVFLNTW